MAYRAKYIVALIAILNLLFTNAQDLRAVECQARLPSGRYFISSVYDGEDTVYLIGGFSQDPIFFRDVFKYSINQDKIVQLQGLPETSVGGTTIMDKNKNMFHFGTYSSSNIFQYNPDMENFTRVSSLPSSAPYFTTVKVDENTALLFGGLYEENRLLELDLNSLETRRLPNLPQELAVDTLSVIWVEERGQAYLFTREGGLGKFNRLSGEFQILLNFFPSNWGASKAVWDGEFGYIVGGFGNEVPPETIIQFDPNTEAVKFIRVEGYPSGNTSDFGQTSAVYVEKLNRIYMFGGLTRNNLSPISRHEIWYISLDTLSPPAQT